MASTIFSPRSLHARSLRLHILSDSFQYGPFNCCVQRRWKKPVDSARTRLEGRTRDHRLDKLMIQLRNLRLALALHELIAQQRNGYASLQLLSKWRHEIGLNIEIGAFLKKYPHIFEVYMHPVKKNHCCKITQRMADLIAEEDAIIRENDIVQRLKKLLMLSKTGTLNTHALWLIRRELGLPDDYRSSVLRNHQHDLSLESPDTLSLVSWDEELAVAKVEEWREKEYTEKWLAESETKYAFPISFPTGFKIEKGFREKLKNWQRLPYTKPYENDGLHPIQNVERLEKRIVGSLHELLSLTVEKMIPLERLSHFRRVFTMEVNLRELLLKHPGIFYISTKGGTQTVLLRESYYKGKAPLRLGISMPSRVENIVKNPDSESLLIGEPTGEFQDVILFFGIIDILQDYDISKKLEHAYKSMQYDPNSISAVDPKQYCKRFRDFIYKAFTEDVQ